MAVYGYCRVSSARQIDRESLGQQQRVIEGYCMMQGVALDHVYVEGGVSGSVPLSERPMGAELLSKLKAGDMVVGAKLDRMFRSASDALVQLESFKKAGVSLHLIDLGGDVVNNGISKLVFTILSAVAEAERDRIRERVRDVKRDQKDRNQYLGGAVPFGYRIKDGQLVAIPDQQTAIATMQRLAGEGQSTRKIAATMQAEGFDVSHVTVAKILKAA